MTRRLPAIDVIFIVLVLAALLVRVRFAANVPYIHDEENTSIPLSRLISFEPGRMNLPLRAVNHPALPAYFVKVSSSVFDETPLGFRMMHVLISLVTIVLGYLMTAQWYDAAAARWAAALVGFNEYFVAISSRATAHGPYLFFATIAVYAFSRFLQRQRAPYLYAAAVAVGLGFYCKEHVVLVLPAFLLTLLHANHRQWLRRPHPYLALLIFLLLIAPDVAWNLRADPAVARVTYGNRDAAQATYANHLQRIGGIAFSIYPTMFYARRPVIAGYAAATGHHLDDNTPEYHSMNAAIGLLLLGSVLVATVRSVRYNDLQRFLLILFWIVFGFFSMIRRGHPTGLDAVSWIWVDLTMIPAAVIAGVCLATLQGKPKYPVWAFGAAAVVYASTAMVLA